MIFKEYVSSTNVLVLSLALKLPAEGIDEQKNNIITNPSLNQHFV